MSFATSLQILAALAGAFALFTLARALRTGRLGYGSAAVVRESDPGQYWHSVAVCAALAGAIALSLADMRFGSAVVQLAMGLSIAVFPWRWLRSGEAGWENAMFSRSEEPLQYWLLVAGFAVLVVLSIALAAVTAIQAWELRGI